MLRVSLPPTTRARWSFIVLTFAGAGGALWEWHDHGVAAAVEPGFLVALTAVMVGMVSWTILAVVPLAVAAYGTGVRDGKACSNCPVWKMQHPEKARHLSSV